ncbi:MAG: energy transducer TonB [Azonexus sp.]|nr:TonB family protein [Azonexus sp.]MCK6412892.1 energy transducer TonB [Azonexus sp.]
MLSLPRALSNWQRWWSPERRLGSALGISLLAHALILLVNFTQLELPRSMRDQAMDIVLVNAKGQRKPADAQALAQASLDGGGNEEGERRAKTPLPASPQKHAGNDLHQTQRRVRQLEREQKKLMTQAQAPQSIASGERRSEQPEPAPTLSGLDLAESAKAMARLEAEIGKSTDEYNKRPRKKNIGIRTSEYRFAQYLEDWRQKVERVGTLNYPPEARGKLYGSLVLTVSLAADGRVQAIEINRSSGYPVLDAAARRIVQLASPYSPFPPDIRRDTDVLEITRTWHFSQGDQLSAR